MSDRRRSRAKQLGIMIRVTRWLILHHRRPPGGRLIRPEPLETTR